VSDGAAGPHGVAFVAAAARVAAKNIRAMFAMTRTAESWWARADGGGESLVSIVQHPTAQLCAFMFIKNKPEHSSFEKSPNIPHNIHHSSPNQPATNA
jgi:hypothetical protein